MKLSTKTRKRIRTAGGKPVEIEWPQGSPECRAGHKHPIYNMEGKYQFRIRVLSTAHWDEGPGTQPEVKAKVRIDHDSVRRLPGLVGQRNESGDYEDEPEPVSATYERQLAAEARAMTWRMGDAQRSVESTKTGGKAQNEAMTRAEKRREEACSFAV